MAGVYYAINSASLSEKHQELNTRGKTLLQLLLNIG